MSGSRFVQVRGESAPWLILNNDSYPFGDEGYMTVTLTMTPTMRSPIDDSGLVEGGMPRQSYASPWVVSPKHIDGRRHAEIYATLEDE